MVTFILVISAIAIFVLGLATYWSGKKSPANRLFFALSVSGAWWQLVNALTITSLFSNTEKLFFVRQITPSSLITVYLLYMFFSSFPVHLKVPKVLNYLVSGIALFFVALSFTDLNVSMVPGDETNPFRLGPIYSYYTAFLIVMILMTIVVLFIGRIKAKGQLKQQANYIVAGTLLSLIPAFITGALLPSLGISFLQDIAPAFAVFFFVFATLAVVKHKLFDITTLVARSIAYVLSVATLVLIYVVLSVVASRILLGGGSGLTIRTQILFIILAIGTAFIIQPMRRFFDRITNKLFFRDAYDSQELLHDLNKFLVSTIDLKELLSNTSHLLIRDMKLEQCCFVLNETKSTKARLIGYQPKITMEEFAELGDVLKDKKNVLLAAHAEVSDPTLYQRLKEQSIAAIVPIAGRSQQKSRVIGYMVLGNKLSGNPITKQDLALVSIIANELVIAVQNALRFEEIQNFNITLQEKVDEATHKLRRTNEKLRQLDETKDDFISMASHQLRTPLTSVKGYVSMVLDGDVGKISSQQRKLLEQAFTSSQRMVYLIADLLNVSRLKTGKFVIESKPTNLAEVVESEIEQLKETAKGRGLKLEYTQPKSFPTLNLDETKIRQVIMNFSDNAIYYTPTGGTITVGLVEKPDSIEFTVVDNGIGVPKSEQHHLFNKFYRAGNAKKARPDGTGLGLFMAQKVVVAQGGAIIFHSEENKGSTFGFSFPKAKLLVK